MDQIYLQTYLWYFLLKVEWVIYDKHNPHTLNHSLNGQYLFSEQELKDRTVYFRETLA